MGKSYYVSVEGNDKNDGSKKSPLQTIIRARDKVREDIKRGFIENIDIIIRGGVYEQHSPLKFDEKDSAVEGQRIHYRGYNDEEVVLLGGRRITGWIRFDNGIWQTDVKDMEFHTLYADGKRVPQARLPASGYYVSAEHDPNTSSDQKTREIHYHEGNLPASFNYEDTQVFVWPGEGEWNWFSETKKVASIDEQLHKIRFQNPSSWPIGSESRYYIQGSLDFLQSPGQFHLDRKKGILYYWPADANANPNKEMIVAPATKRLLEFNGSAADQPVRHLHFSGISLSCTDFFDEYTMMDENVEQPQHREGIIYINRASGIRIENCKISLSGSCGIYLDHYANEIKISDNTIGQLGYNGISLSGFAPGKGPFNNASESFTNGRHCITNNVISHGGQLVGHGCGILLYQSGGNKIMNNRIAEMPRYGISLKGLRHKTMPKKLYNTEVTWENHWDFLHSRNNFIGFNDISEVMTDSQDGGMIEAWGVGKGNIIHSNYLHDSGIHFSFGFGIYLDDAADGFTITHNVLHRLYSTGDGKLWMLIFSKGIGNKIMNNLLVSNPHAISAIGSQEMADEENKDIEIASNIIYNSGYLYYFVNYQEDRFNSANHNLYFRNNAPCLIAGKLPLKPLGPDCLERFEYEWSEWRSLQNGKYDQQSLIADPLFRNELEADFRLQQASPAYELGWNDISFYEIGPKWIR
ncbi:right-handed parallel beta-helix repeat-containing protein [Paenibacillus sp. HB172176]|uniref:right-handed parallel beta-helix repeat-containing protein n=1 Tax=Paenibacillus sp. HB172176 TaxID=2493690 RepID=UPI00143AD17F|nr:right-handed parallel beta-helix repeat-containing protein [Paenibacillus sp. HB172176]